MLFYHFTHPGTVLRIAGEGLKPAIQEDDWQTMGQSAIWLTRDESNIATAEHVEHFQKHGVERKVGDFLYGGAAPMIKPISVSSSVIPA